MGSLDIPPPHVPSWVVPLHTVLMSIAFLLWSACYVLMTRRSFATKSYGMPLLALATNVSWEIVNLFYVCEMPLEKIGLAMWLVLDMPIVWATIKFAPEEWKDSSKWMGRNIGYVLFLMTAVGCACHYGFTVWWLAERGRGYGEGGGGGGGGGGGINKDGKFWGGREGFDTSEMAFWSSGVSQVICSWGSLSMLQKRRHSGGTDYSIWFCRSLGTLVGPVLGYIPLWLYWPEAHGYVVSWLSAFIWGPAIACDLAYPFVLRRFRRSEVVLPDGRVTGGRGQRVPTDKTSAQDGKKNL
ncbi:hypothetical protein QBC43DRAFT_336949 [Cladorrhinum sp. PSN259]|nr:hypothetical protein QBC43DRAFT_336949 [Cladorrhinum sp. PSN259]